MKIEFTRQQAYNLLFELITAKTEEQTRLEAVFSCGCSKDSIEYQQDCLKRAEELIEIIENALRAPFD